MRKPFLPLTLPRPWFVLLFAFGTLSAARAQARLGIKINNSTTTVTQVNPESAAAKAGLKPGDIIIGLNNHALTNGTKEFLSVMANTRPGSLLPISIRRDGHVMTLLAFPGPAPAGTDTGSAAAAQGAAKSIAVQSGHYNCMTFTFVAGGLGAAPSSLYTGIDLRDGGSYMVLKSTGKFHPDPASDRLVFDSGPLSQAVAHYKRDQSGTAKISFQQAENEHGINGHAIDRGPTACYLK